MSKKIEDVIEKLSTLEPTQGEKPLPAEGNGPAAARAFNTLKAALPAETTSPGIGFGRINSMVTFQQKFARAGAVAVLAVLIAFFGFSPVGQALAGDFLGIFRVQKFAPISISPERLSQLEEMDFEGLYPGEVNWTEKPVDPVAVGSLTEAADMAGFNPLAADLTNNLGQPADIGVAGSGSGELIVDLAAARTILNIAGVDGTLLPDSLDGATIAVDVETGIVASWEQYNTTLMQMPSPQISYPSDFDPAPVGQALLQFLGVEAEEAARLANAIDWTNTLVLPFPQGFGSFEEVTVNGSPGLMITADGDFSRFDERGRDFEREFDSDQMPSAPLNSLIWESNGMLYMLSADVDKIALLQLADGN